MGDIANGKWDNETRIVIVTIVIVTIVKMKLHYENRKQQANLCASLAYAGAHKDGAQIAI